MENYKLDETDIGILALLQVDGLMTYKELAHKLGRTVTPIAERVGRLKKIGFIKRTVAIVDIHKIHTSLIAFPHIILTKQTENALKQFQEEVVLFPEVWNGYHLTGNFDFMLKIVMPDWFLIMIS